MVVAHAAARENGIAELPRHGFYSKFYQYMVRVPGTSRARLGAKHNI
jgi:putative heme iron utilization protein